MIPHRVFFKYPEWKFEEISSHLYFGPFFMTIFLTRLTFVIFRHFTAGYKRPWKEDVTADFRHSSFIFSAILSHINTNPVGEQQLHTVQYCSQAGETVGFPGWELTLGHTHTHTDLTINQLWGQQINWSQMQLCKTVKLFPQGISVEKMPCRWITWEWSWRKRSKSYINIQKYERKLT